MIKMFITGRITRDLEPKYSESGKCNVKFSLATDRVFGDKKKTVFVDCVAFDKKAEVMGNTLGKGRKILVMGEYDVYEYEKDGVKHRIPQCIVTDFEYMDSKKDGQAQPNNDVNQFGADIDEQIPF